VPASDLVRLTILAVAAVVLVPPVTAGE
jgi:hypothetical protein